jgi:hypothetical protein
MDDPVSQGIETCSEPGLFASSMSFSPNGAPCNNAVCAAIGPCDGESDEYEQGRELVRFGNVGVFDIEPRGDRGNLDQALRWIA